MSRGATRLAVRYACHPLLVFFWGATGLVAFLPFGRAGGMSAGTAGVIFGVFALPVVGSVWLSRLDELRRQVAVLPVGRGRTLLVFAFVGPLLTGIGVGVGIPWWPGGGASVALPAANLALSIVVALTLVGVFVRPGLSEGRALLSLVPFGIVLSLCVVGTGLGRSPALLLVLVGVLVLVSWAAERQERRMEVAPRADPAPAGRKTSGRTGSAPLSGWVSLGSLSPAPTPVRARSPIRVEWARSGRWFYWTAVPLAAWGAGSVGFDGVAAFWMLWAPVLTTIFIDDTTGIRRWLLTTPWPRRRTFRLVALPIVLAGVLASLIFVVAAWTTADRADLRLGPLDLDEQILAHEPGLGTTTQAEFRRLPAERQAEVLSVWLRARFGLSVAPGDVPPPDVREPGNPAWDSLRNRVAAVVRARGGVLAAVWLLAFLALFAFGNGRRWWTIPLMVGILAIGFGIMFSELLRYEVFRLGVPIVDALASRLWIVAPVTMGGAVWLIRRARRRVYREEWIDLATAGSR